MTLKSPKSKVISESIRIDWIGDVKRNPNRALQIIYIDHRIGCINWISSKFRIMPEDARDIFQSAVVVMYENVMTDKITNKQANLRSYLIGICNNLSHAWLRREKKHSSSLPMPILVDYMFEDLDGQEAKKEQFKLCKKCMSNLGSPCKEIVTMFYFEGKTMQEIMDILDYKNVQTVKSQKYKCMQRLKKLMAS